MTDFENTPLKGKNGKIIRYHNGKPILYKHFLNDLPDEEHERENRKNRTNSLVYHLLKFGTPIPDVVKLTDKQMEEGRKYFEMLEAATTKST